MAKFLVKFEREVIQTDQFARIIEAETEEEARAKARAMADDANHSCPDDVATAGGDCCGDWDVDSLAPASVADVQAYGEEEA